MEPQERYSQRIEKVCRRLAEHFIEVKDSGIPSWPFSFAEREIFLSNFFPRELYWTLKKLEKKGLSSSEIAKLFKNPSRITHFFYTIIIPRNNLSKEQNIELIEKLCDFIEFFKKEDPFCEERKNILLSKKQIENYAPFLKKIEDEETRKTIGEINALLFQYKELIFAGIPVYGHEFHGPYKINEELMIIQDHYELKPTEIWPSTEKFPFNKIRIIETFKKGEIKIDFFSHLETSFSIPKALSKYCILADGKSLDISYLKELKEILIKIISAITQEAIPLNKEDWISKSSDLWGFYLKPCKDILKENWKIKIDINKIKAKIKIETKQFLKGRKMMMDAPDEEAKNRLVRLFLKNVYKENWRLFSNAMD